MKYNMNIKSCEEFFKKISDDPFFTTEKSMSGLTLRYNSVFTLITNPKINLIKISDTELEIDILPGLFTIIICIIFTLFFWVLAAAAAILHKLSTALIIAVFLLPSLIWILNIWLNKSITKHIVERLNYINNSNCDTDKRND